MDHFAGLDVSVKETSVCIVDDTGRIVKEVKVASEPQTLLKVLGNPAYRFKRIGLEAGPLRYQSGEIDWSGKISRCGDEMMRTMLYEAAQSMMHSKKWSWLKAWAMQIARRRGMKKAIVALARRLAVIMHRIWVDGTEFRWTREQATTAA